jgi:hypothetical protein
LDDFIVALTLDAYLLSQLLAGAAIVSDAVSFQCQRREYILGCLVVSSALLAGHFYLLEIYTAAYIGVLSIFRFLLSIFYTRKWLMWLFLCMTMAVAVWTYNGYLTVLSSVATSCFTVAAFQLNEKRLRLMSIAAVCLWILHNSLVGSVMGALLECIFLTSCLIGYYRFMKRSNPEVVA